MKRPAQHSWNLHCLRDLIAPLDRNRAGDLARGLNNLDPELGLDLDLVVEAAHTLGSVLGLNGDHVLDEARGWASALGNSLLELTRAATDAREFASARGNAATHARELASVLGRAASHARELANDHDHARSHAVVRVRDLDRDLLRDLARDLARYHGLAGSLAVYLAFHSVTPEVKERVARSAKSMPGRVVALAVRMLPTSERVRYREEYRSELLDPQFLMLPRRKRLGYALRVLVRAPALRWALREPSHRVER
ncbi:MAG: hypothetical protein ACRDQ4_06855 [Pseudonocardiaceae bacterium]